MGQICVLLGWCVCHGVSLFVAAEFSYLSVWVLQLCHGLCSGGTSVFFGQSMCSGGNVCVVGRVYALWVESV